MKTPSNKAAATLQYQGMGISIIPTGRDKKPLLNSWLQFQTEAASEELIQKWWSKNPDANPAMVTGEVSRFITLDVDVKNGVDGRKSLGPMPLTACYETGSGGMQYIFKHPGFFVPTRSGVREGLDIRGDGGYALLPPSENENGPYTMVVPFEDGVADMPEWLVSEIKAMTVNKKEDFHDILVGVPDGKRNDAACSLTGKLLHHLPEKDWYVAEQYMRDWNQKNSPPLPEQELMAKFNGLVKSEKQKRTTTQVPQLVESKPLTLRELTNMDIPPTDWDVKGLFEHATPNMLSAAPNNFKTWLVDVIAISLASGEKLFGHFDIKQQGVLIVSEEDGVGITKNRFGMLLKKGKEDLPIYLHIQKGFKLTEEVVEQLLAQAKELKVSFIIFDSLRAVHLGDENNSQEMQKVMDFLMMFTREGITVLFTHHHRKKMRGFGAKQDSTGEESRGSTSINAAVHGHITCEHKQIDGEDKLVISQPKLKCDKKLLPFLVGIKSGHNMDSVEFIYEGEYGDEGTKELLKSKILSLLKSDNKWLNKKQLMGSINVGGETTLNIVLKELTADKALVVKTRGEVEKLGLPHDGEGAHNSNYYQLEENDDF